MEEQEQQENVDSSKTDKLREIFAIFDRDDSGSIDPDELGVGLRALGCNPTDSDIEQMMQDALDKVDEETGKLNFDAFTEIISKYQKNVDDVETDLLGAFMYFDKNGDGSIDRTELREALKSFGHDKLSDEEVDELFADANVDDNDRINYHELVAAMCKT